MEKAETVFARSLQWVKRQQRAWVLVATVVCPAIFSLFTSFQDSIQPKVIWWSFLIFILLIWLTGTIFALGGPKTPLAVLQEIQSLQDDLKISQENLELIERLGKVNNLRVITILKWLDLVAAKAADGKIDDHTFDLEVSAVLSSLDNLVLDAAAVSISTLLELYGADNNAIIQSRYGGMNDDQQQYSP